MDKKEIDGNYENRINDFIMSLKQLDNDIETLKDYALHNDVPIIRDETRELLELILKISKPRKILELGTAIAYSTLVIYKACDGNIDSIITVENYGDRVLKAQENIDKYINDSRVQLIDKDITEYLKEIDDNETFDFIFLDAAKAQYVVWLPYIKKHMKKGSILLSDNVFKDGEIIESRYTIIKRDRTIHKRMREFLHMISKDEEFDTNILNIGDGISISIRK